MNALKKLIVFVLTIAMVFSNFFVNIVDTHAAEKTKTTTNVYDSKTGVCYPSKIRVEVGQVQEGSGYSWEENIAYAYLLQEGDYVASVKTNSPNLIAKVTRKYINENDNYLDAALDGQESPNFKSRYGISFFASKKGTYTATITIKNANKKTVCKKKIKVYAEKYLPPIKFVKYAGKKVPYSLLTKKKSGKIQVSMNKGYKIQKIEVGTYGIDKEYKDYNPELEYKTVKNQQKIKIATTTRYASGVSSFEFGEYSYKSGYYDDYLFPVTAIRITYKDIKLGISETQEYFLYYEKE